jgi:hypothetical protein
MPESAAKTSSVKMPWRAPSDTAVNVETLKALQVNSHVLSLSIHHLNICKY